MEIQPNFVEFEPETESESLFQASMSRQSQFNEAVQAAIEIAAQVDPYQQVLGEGVVIPTLDAVNWSSKNVDIRPRLVEASGVERLVDSGAQISAAVRLPSDKPDQNVSLVAVNGSKIRTFGVRELKIKINRKTYTIEAVVCDNIKQDILGMDFLHKYKLGLEWDDETQSKLFIRDKKADIKKPDI